MNSMAHSRSQPPSRSRLSLFGWLTVWLLAMPLVHIHPEADHRHGRADHVHGGQFHTLLSTALSCEFARSPEHGETGSAIRSTGEGHDRIGLPGHFLEHPGVAFTILVDSTERNDNKGPSYPAVVDGTCDPFVPSITRSIPPFPFPTFPQNWPPPHRPRGPPVFVL